MSQFTFLDPTLGLTTTPVNHLISTSSQTNTRTHGLRHPSPNSEATPEPSSHSQAPSAIPTSLERAQTLWRQLFSTSAPTASPSDVRPTTLNTSNSRTNEPWGDLLQDKPDDVTRVYVTNLNGLQLDARGGKFDTVCRIIREIKADVF